VGEPDDANVLGNISSASSPLDGLRAWEVREHAVRRRRNRTIEESPHTHNPPPSRRAAWEKRRSRPDFVKALPHRTDSDRPAGHRFDDLLYDGTRRIYAEVWADPSQTADVRRMSRAREVDAV